MSGSFDLYPDLEAEDKEIEFLDDFNQSLPTRRVLTKSKKMFS